MVKTMARRPAVASRSPSQVPRPARPAWRRLRRARYSPAKAPRKGPSTTPGRKKNRPITPPRKAPKTARPLAPTRWAPWRAAQSSMAKEPRVSRASSTSVTTPTRWKPSIRAPTSSPRKTSGAPGSSGSTAPTIPAATSRPATSHSTELSSALAGRTATANQPAAASSAPRIAGPGRRAQRTGGPRMEPVEAAAVQPPVRKVVVVGDDAARGHLVDPLQTAADQVRRCVEDGRRQVEVEEVAGEQVAGEQQVVRLAVETAVPLGVTGQMHHAQATPVRQQVAIGEPGVDRRGTVTQHAAAESLEPAAPADRAPVGIAALDVQLLLGVREHFRAAPPPDRPQVAGVVEMAMGEQDGRERSRLEAESPHAAAQQRQLAVETGVDQAGRAAAVLVHQQVTDAHYPAQRVDAWRQGVDGLSLTVAHGQQALQVAGPPITGVPVTGARAAALRTPPRPAARGRFVEAARAGGPPRGGD